MFQLESKRYEFTDLQTQLSNTEESLKNLQKEYVRADSERDSLKDALRRFQSSVSRIMKLNRFRAATDDDGKPDTSGDLTDDVIFKSAPFPPAPDFPSDSTTINIDLSNLDSTLQNLGKNLNILIFESWFFGFDHIFN